MIQERKITIAAYIISVIVVMLFLILYFIKFNGSLSDKCTDWASFGSYIGGTAMIVLTSLNIFVFIKLTKAVSKSDEENKKKELSFQKKNILTQMRKNEFDRFIDIINKPIENYTDSNIMLAENAIDNFLIESNSLFNLNQTDKEALKEDFDKYKEELKKRSDVSKYRNMIYNILQHYIISELDTLS